MTHTDRQALLRSIPPVDEILAEPGVAALRATHPKFPWTRLVRDILEDFRALKSPPADLGSPTREAVTQWVGGEVARRVGDLRTGGLVRVLNGTGVMLHTNLGRALLGDAAVTAARDAMTGYVTLEVDRESGARSKRGIVLARLIEMATGSEASMVVNNNAAAVYLVANSFSPPGRVIVSRGELVEIGGSFRLPEILRHAAADVVEVGTTNRTYAKDYEAVATPDDLILKVHKSNYAIEGFAHEASVEELVEVGRRVGCPVAYDVGSGALHDYRADGLGKDPSLCVTVESGVDLITMSGDKLLGGPQAGIVLGRAAAVQRLKQNPLRRALRVDKVTIAALQEVFRCYLFDGAPEHGVPVIAQTREPAQRTMVRAQSLAEALKGAGRNVRAAEDDAVVGGGSLSTETVPSAALSIMCGTEDQALRLGRALRTGSPAVFTRIKGSEVRVNLATIKPEEDGELRDTLAAALDRMS